MLLPLSAMHETAPSATCFQHYAHQGNWVRQWLSRRPLQLWAQQWWLTLKERGLGQARRRPSRFPLLPRALGQGQAQTRPSRSLLLPQVLAQVQGLAQPQRRVQQLWRSVPVPVTLQGSRYESGPGVGPFVAHIVAFERHGVQAGGDSQAFRHTHVWFQCQAPLCQSMRATGKEHLLGVPLASLLSWRHSSKAVVAVTRVSSSCGGNLQCVRPWSSNGVARAPPVVAGGGVGAGVSVCTGVSG